MTQKEFMKRLESQGASEREAEIINIRVYPEWRKLPATKLTRKQYQDIRTLLFDLREDDELSARIDNDVRNRRIAAGY